MEGKNQHGTLPWIRKQEACVHERTKKTVLRLSFGNVSARSYMPSAHLRILMNGLVQYEDAIFQLSSLRTVISDSVSFETEQR